MQGIMNQAVMTGIKKIEMQKSEIPQPGQGEVLVKIGYVGVCGSDLHFFEDGSFGSDGAFRPFILGHESAGTVVDVGAGVTHLKVGDRVALEPGKTCGRCEACLEGNYNLCPDVKFFATPNVDGTFREYVAHEAKLCFKLPDNVGIMEGALIEPLAVGFHSAIQGGATVGQSAVIFGAGCIGLVTLLALKAMGVGDVYVVDVLENRLKKAMELGAAGVINGAGADVNAELKKIFGKRGCDLALETSGAQPCVEQAVLALKKAGTLVIVANYHSGKVMFPMGAAMVREITVKPIFRYRHIYPMSIKAVSDGLVDL
ncbi:MAG: NAD(P)-dependent alcohol dehydrogenase, partial [Oscillospiraceae bacterium]|nr:NAD(P)-dependent alcohol dehydrogenase [Oscillospiraceae bacterium]